MGTDRERQFSSALGEEWHVDKITEVLEGLNACFTSDLRIQPAELKTWARAHLNDSAAVIECMRVVPPQEIAIVGLLPHQAGYHKRVFRGQWRSSGRPVVLKQFRSIEERERLVHREERAHPLAMDCPYVVESYPMANTDGELFLVEEYLSGVLDDAWRANGLEEAINLLSDLTHALACLHDEHQMVHGDVKPDNIGMKHDHFVLLDFGTARTIREVAKNPTATGSLRTRAPELLAAGQYDKDPAAADIWALGAVIYHSLVGRFPFLRAKESVPAPNHVKARMRFQKELQRRATLETGKWIVLTRLPPAIRNVLGDILVTDPKKRPSGDQILSTIQLSLSTYLRTPHPAVSPRHINPELEIDQLSRSLLDQGRPELVPENRRLEVREQLEHWLEHRTLSLAARNRAVEVLAALTEHPDAT